VTRRRVQAAAAADDLQGHVAAQNFIVGTINDTHPPFPDFRDNTPVAQQFTDQNTVPLVIDVIPTSDRCRACRRRDDANGGCRIHLSRDRAGLRTTATPEFDSRLSFAFATPNI